MSARFEEPWPEPSVSGLAFGFSVPFLLKMKNHLHLQIQNIEFGSG